MLAQKIQDDLTKSLKAKESEIVETLRLVRSEIQNAQIEKGSELSDEDIVVVLKKYVKKLKDACEMFRQGGRDELADQNEAQIDIISQYLPAEMSDTDLKKAIDELIEENKEMYESKPQAIIGIAMKKLSSQADPQRIMKELKSR